MDIYGHLLDDVRVDAARAMDERFRRRLEG